MLFLFTDVTEQDAPTRIRVGSHQDMPAVLAPHGERGTSIFTVAAEVDAATAHRLQVLATGPAGDVFLCHPFLVHAAQPHHGARRGLRLLGQRAGHVAREESRREVPARLCRPDGHIGRLRADAARAGCQMLTPCELMYATGSMSEP